MAMIAISRVPRRPHQRPHDGGVARQGLAVGGAEGEGNAVRDRHHFDRRRNAAGLQRVGFDAVLDDRVRLDQRRRDHGGR